MAKNDLAAFREVHKDLIFFLDANVGNEIEVTMIDGQKYQTLVDNVDSEGFVHHVDHELFWTGFDSVQEYRTLPRLG